jgi:hypothetical protein
MPPLPFKIPLSATHTLPSGVVEGRGNEHLDDGRSAPAVANAIATGFIHVGQAWRQDDARRVVVARRRQRRKRRQLRQRNVHAERARACLPPLHALRHRRWDHFAGQEFLEKLLRINVRNDCARPERCAIFQNDSGSAAALHDDFANRQAHIDANAVLAGCPGHRLRYRAHASDGMPPYASFAVHFTRQPRNGPAEAVAKCVPL